MSETSSGVKDLAFVVRDYECDMGHVVNNAIYLNYLEHARHELLRNLGVRFGDLAKRGIVLVVTRIEADFKGSLTSGDTFVVRTKLQRKGRLRLQFIQHIYRAIDNHLMLSALVTGTALNDRGRPEIPSELVVALESESFEMVGQAECGQPTGLSITERVSAGER